MTIKTTTLELTVNPEYVRSWGVWEALRELLQNAIDSHEKGNTMEVTYSRTVGRSSAEGVPLRIINRGARLSRDTLLLGTTSKADDATQRGQFGEGYKLAFLVLARAGIPVVIKNDDELWKPFIGHSETFGANVLKIGISPRVSDGNVSIEVYGLGPEVWQQVQDRCLFLQSPSADETFELGSGDKMLSGDKYRNFLYARGIFVGPLPDGYTYGYDLSGVKLDRDRRLADPWELRYAIKNALARGVAGGFISAEKMIELANQETGEARTLLDSYRYGSSDALSQKMAAAFRDIHGSEVIPVSSLADSAEALSNGLRPVMVAESLKTVLEKEFGQFQARKKDREFEIKQRYSAADLSKGELGNLGWAQDLLLSTEPDFDVNRVQVVEFYGEKIWGRVLPSTMEIALAKIALQKPEDCLRVLVHEYCHKYGSDGSFEHNEAQVRVLAKIAANWLR